MTDSMDDWERRREERRQKREEMRRETERMISLRSCEDEEEVAMERRRRAREERLRSGGASQEPPGGDAPVNNVGQDTDAKSDGGGGDGADAAERLRRREERRQKRQQQQPDDEEEEAAAAAAAAAAREEEAKRERERDKERERERREREMELRRQQEEEEEERRLRQEEEEEEERKKALEDDKDEDDYDEKKAGDSRSWGKSGEEASRANGRSQGLGHDDDDEEDEADDDEEEEERRRQEEEEERAAHEEEKQRRSEQAERRRLAEEKRQKMSAADASPVDADESFGGLLPRASGKLSEMTESLSRSVQRSGSLKSKQPQLEICKIDSKLELYTSAAESAAKAAKPPKQGVSDLPATVETIASKKNMWETGDVYSGVATPKGSSNKELAVIKVGVANRISQWGTKSPDVADGKAQAQPAKPTDLRPVDILSKRSMWEHMSDAPPSERDKSGLNKSTPSGKRYKFIITGHGKYEKVPIEEGEDCENGLEQYVNEV